MHKKAWRMLIGGAGKLAVVGVGPGLGAAIVRRFERGRYIVAILARDLDKLVELHRPPQISIDCSDSKLIKEVFEAVNSLGGVEALVPPKTPVNGNRRVEDHGHWDQTYRSLSTRALSPGGFRKWEQGIHGSGGLMLRSFYSSSIRNERNERDSSAGAESSPGASSSSGPSPARPSHLQSSLVADDFRSLIVSRKREVAILEAALEILETAPRDKRIEDLVRKHDILLERVHGDLTVKSNIEYERASTVEPTSQIVGSSDVKNDFAENDIVDLEPVVIAPSDNQEARRWNSAQLQSRKMDSTTFGKHSFDDYPPPQDPNFERLQKKRRRQELMKEHELNSKIESLNFGAAAKSAVGGSNSRVDSVVDPLRPNATAFLDQQDKKPYRSLADRLYEEQFGHPAPPGLKRTYPKGSFYDRCMKEKEQKERDAAATPSPRRM